MTLFSSRLLLLPLTLALAHCGGGGGEAVGAPTTPPVAADPYAGTAYQKVQITTLAKGGGPGLARSNVQALIDQCNAFRKSFHDLPPSPPVDEALMAGLDAQVWERYYDNHKSAETVSYYGLRLTDYERWQADLKASTSAVPSVAPNCSATEKDEVRERLMYLWMDKVRYELRHDTKKALARREHISFTPTDLATSSQVAAWPAKTVMGESCRVASTPAEPALDGACLWERFPARKYLNLPWALESVTGAVQEVRVVTLALERDKPLRAGVLAIPAGFTVQVD
jgi:hypothetical protein